jgi:16S rRNA (guanine966-N2)-methyltransferase
MGARSGGRAAGLRIIGGEWRGRRIRVTDTAGLRPTPDRVRETLFNWLRPILAGARCLDLFAGSGALGLEALSQGAAEVTFVELDPAPAASIGAHLRALGAQGRGRVMQVDALHWLGGPVQAVDVVFLDPPFDAPLLAPACALLESRGWLRPRAHVYLEHRAGSEPPGLPSTWRLLRSKRAGDVGYHLAARDDAADQAGRLP